jgi:predicted RNA binding protein YcfA (HicA-like mRNA interferase family)
VTKVPSLSYDAVVKALRRAGWVVVRQRGSHIRLQKHVERQTLKLIVPAASADQALDAGAHPEAGPPLDRRVYQGTLRPARVL